MINYNLEAPKEKILEVLGISNEKFNHLLKIFSIDTDASQFNKKQLDAFIQYLNFTKECKVNINYDDSIFTEYPKRKPFTLEEIINFKKKTTAPKRIAATINKKELIALEHQIEATTNILNEFKISDRTQLISACGTGKTFIAKEVTESIVKPKEDTTTLIFVPTLALLLQFYNSWIKSINILEHKKPFVICGDDDLLNDNEFKIKREDLKFNINTSVEYIISYLLDEQIEHKLLLCTYQSAKLIKEAMTVVDKTIDLGIFDEAHKTVGCIEKDFAFALFDENIKIHKRLFMTATPKHVISSNKQNVLSMNDEKIYGKVAYELSMRNAINKGIIKDYQIVVSVIDSSLYKELKPLLKDLSKEQILDELLAVNFIKFIKEKDIKKSVSFHGTIKESKRFVNNKHIQNHFGKTITHIDGNTSSKNRTKELFHLNFHHEKHISNSKLLSEGIDVPSIEAIAIFSSSKSIVDITQRVGRVQRKEHEHDYKMGYLFLPVILDEVYFDIGIDACVNKYQYILDVLTYLKESDSQIKMFFNQKDKPQEIAKKLFNYIEIDSFDEIKEDSFNQFNELIINIVNRIRLKVYGNDDNEDKWNRAYAKVIEFYKLFNRFPRKRAESDNEKMLGSWCAIQKTLYKKNLLTNEKIKLLDEIDFKWDEFQEKWNKRFLELENFIKKNNFLPQNMRNGKYTSKKEKGLRKWFNDQRFRKKENTLEQWKIIKLDALLNNLNFKVDLKDNDEVWEESYQKFIQFVKENKKLPTDVKKDSNQRMVYIWYLKQREKFQNNELTKEQIQKLNICKFKWNQDKFSLRWDNNYKKLVKLNKKYGGIPSNSKIYTENNLIKWFKSYLKKYNDKNNKLNESEANNYSKLKEMKVLY